MASTRNIGLDYLRSLAILIVLANHALLGFFISTSKVKFEGFTASLSASTVISIEWLFVLSGFLIGAMMIRSFEKNASFLQCARDFWLRRWFRTIPNYYLFVFVNLLLVTLGLADGKFEYKYFAFSQNLAWIETAPHFFGESWSLALDEWFYLTMPILLGVLSLVIKSRKIAFISASCVLILAPMLGRIFHTTPVEFFQWDAEIRRITIYHLDATGWGVLAASINKWFPNWWRSGVKNKAMYGFASMLVGVFLVTGLLNPVYMNQYLYDFANAFSITLMAGGTFLIIPWLTSWRMPELSLNWVVEKISLFSYSIYLVHFPLIFIFKYLFTMDLSTSPLQMMMIVGGWLFSIMALSAVIFHLFEKPVADLRESFTKRVDASPF
jgi:peptidoglycan/LPS O-acetylase OafA/YrhL